MRFFLIFLSIILSNFTFFGQGNNKTIQKMETTTPKMKVEIWSDIMCPFCYIGKRKFEAALEQFPNKNHVEIEWKSFQLMPDLRTQPDKNIDDILVESKGVSLKQAQEMNNYAVQLGKQAGLDYRLDIAIPANSFNAHRFSWFAKQYGKQNEAEELLFRSYFTEGKNVDDYATLVQLGEKIGLDAGALKSALESNQFADEVREDIYEAQQFGIRGVPFFVFNRKYAVSGAQDSKVFLETLEKAFAEWRKENPEKPTLEVIDGKVCTPSGECE
jgi:predicted DsbA family dithiol-disulfide isomerase